MSIRALTADGQDLLDEIKAQIDQGHIETWSYSQAGEFTHTPPQWKNKAWLRPKVETDRLRLRVLNPKNEEVSREVFAVYQGRFIEMLVKHVPAHFTDARATPNPDKDEITLED